jgi:hypothetical protein
LREADEAKALRLTVVRGGVLQAHRRLCAMFATLRHRTARARPASVRSRSNSHCWRQR